MEILETILLVPVLVYVILIIFYLKFLKPFETKITVMEKKTLVLEVKITETQEIKNEIHLLRSEINEIKKILINKK